jgi:hypothetical protein
MSESSVVHSETTLGVGGNIHLRREFVVRAYGAVTLFILMAFVGAAVQAHEHLGGDPGGPTSLQVNSVNPGSPASAAGLEPGDILVRLDGREILTVDALKEVMATRQSGDTVPMTVERDGEIVELDLTYGGAPDGGVSLGVSLNVTQSKAAGGAAGNSAGSDAGTEQCLAWVEETYQVIPLMEKLDLDLADVYESMRDCTARDTRTMSTEDAVRYCDNVFKVHCSGVDLLTELGESQVEHCAMTLDATLGVKTAQYKGWKTCAEEAVYGGYVRSGEVSDEEGCRSTLLDECGSHLVTEGNDTLQLTSAQQEFIGCCSADNLGGSDICPMIDDGFSRGPCRDQPVCINTMTTEWIQCAEAR